MRRYVVYLYLLLLALSTFPSQLLVVPAGPIPETLPGIGAGPSVIADPPGEELTMPAPEVLRVQPAIEVLTLRQARAHTGRGNFNLVVEEMAAGTGLTYLGSREGWFLVRTPSGGVGWLNSADAELREVGESVGMKYRAQPAPARWEIGAPTGARVEVNRLVAGVLRVVLTSGGQEQLAWGESGTDSIAVVFDSAQTFGAPSFQGSLDIGDAGIGLVSLSNLGVLIDLENAPLHRLVSRGPGRVELEFLPGLAAVQPLADGWMLSVRGDVRPSLKSVDGMLQVDLLGMIVDDAFAPTLPVRAQLVQTESVGPGRGGLRLVVPLDSQLYGLYRLDPTTLVVRFLPPGLQAKRIVLDPGHGGEEIGAGGQAGTAEKNVNLAVALGLRDLLEAAGAKVIMVRTTDTRALPAERAATLVMASQRIRADLDYRVELSNQAGADLYLSIHGNGGPATEHGTETYWSQVNLNASQSQRLAG